jgi:hypothetical protein
MRFSKILVYVFLCLLASARVGEAEPTVESPLEVNAETKEVRIFGIIYPMRFNAAQGEEARYHLIVWKGGASPNALIETPVDDLAFHTALESLGAQPGDNLSMASWTKRHDQNNPAPKEKVTGSRLDIQLSWEKNPVGMPIAQAFRQRETKNEKPETWLEFRFGGNRDRWFNRVPLAHRPGCVMCLYSCPSGKVSNGALSIHDYMAVPFRFMADTTTLPPDGEAVIVTVKLRQAS